MPLLSPAISAAIIYSRHTLAISKLPNGTTQGFRQPAILTSLSGSSMCPFFTADSITFVDCSSLRTNMHSLLNRYSSEPCVHKHFYQNQQLTIIPFTEPMSFRTHLECKTTHVSDSPTHQCPAVDGTFSSFHLRSASATVSI